MSIFRAWCQVRGVKKKVEVLSVKKLSELLPLFVMDARQQDDSPYLPNTLVGLVAGIQCHLQENGHPELAILKENDPMYCWYSKRLVCGILVACLICCNCTCL